MVLDAWDEVRIDAPATARVADIKQRALEETRITRAPESYVLKHRGWEVPEGATLSEAGIGPNAALIVLPRRRQPVR
jgi:hypothetical protein